MDGTKNPIKRKNASSSSSKCELDTNSSSQSCDSPNLILTYDEALEKVGGFGRYQIFCLFTAMILCAGTAYYNKNAPYLWLMPKLECKSDSGGYSSCTNVCDLDGSVRDKSEWRIDYSNQYSFNNFVTEFEFYCMSPIEICYFNSFWFIGFILSSLIIKVSDNFGRIKILKIAAFCQVGLCLSFYFIRYPKMHYLFYFLSGINDCKFTVSYIYLKEIIPQKHIILVCAILFSAAVGFAVYPTSLYFLLGGKEWSEILILSIVGSIIGAICVSFMPESPKYLFLKGRDLEGKKILQQISWANNANEFDTDIDVTIDDIPTNENNKANENSESDYAYGNFQVILNFLACLSSSLCAAFNYYFIVFFMKYVKGNLYHNTIIGVTAEIIGCFSFSYMNSKLGTKYANLLFSTLLGGSFFLMVNLENPTLILIFIIIAKFSLETVFILSYNIAPKLFSARTEGQIFYISLLISRIMSTYAPIAAELESPYPILIFYSCLIPSIVFTTVCLKA